jgi:hypothetical protein
MRPITADDVAEVYRDRVATYGARRKTTGPVKVKLPPAAVKPSVSATELADFIAAGEQTNLLFTFVPPSAGPADGNGYRNVAAEEWEYCVLPIKLPAPRFGTQYHTTGGAPFGENTGMIDDYRQQRRAVGMLLSDPVVSDLMTRAYGADYRLADDRAFYRKHGLDAERKLQTTVHVDYPSWQRLDTPVPVQTAVWPAQSLCVIALRQSKPHGIPLGGHSESGGMVVGYFVSPLTARQYAAYCKATLQRYEKECASQGKKNVYMWPELCRLGPSVRPQHLFAAAIMYGLRPILYPSRKPIDVPQTYAASVYSKYLGYTPDETQLKFDATAEISALPQPYRRYFSDVAAAFPHLKLACALSSLSHEYLYRTLGLAAFEDVGVVRAGSQVYEVPGDMIDPLTGYFKR